MILATTNTIRNESCTLYELKCFLKHLKLSAERSNTYLRWKYKDGKYIGYIKRDGNIIFEKEYKELTLLDNIIAMHLDFEQILYTGALSK